MVSDTDIYRKNHGDRHFLSSLIKWNFHSTKALDKAEDRMLAGINSSYNKFYVDIGPCVSTDNEKIWTLSINTDSKNVPIVLVHGFGAAIGFWALNFDCFAADRAVYALDLLGYGKSSRPKFSKDAKEVEKQYITSLEKWRQCMKIDKMIILGHSFGGFLSTSYAMNFPERIEHLILADPWGFIGCSDEYKKSLYKRTSMFLTSKISPLFIVRAAGPLGGPFLLRKARPDIVEKYENVIEKHDKTIAKYVYHCNTQKITGEYAFRNLLDIGVYPKYPMCTRLHELCDSIPVTFIFGSASWLDNSYGQSIKELRPNGYTRIEYIEEAGHQLFSDNAAEFNRLVIEACKVLKSHAD